ncbi:MAG: MFS transporter [Chloroflexi bacterium]|nr:MFS transporter [Chloroflexota bacterium]
MRTGKWLRFAGALLLLFVATAPTAVLAKEGGHNQTTTHMVYQDGHEDESAEEVSATGDGVGFVLTLIAFIIGLIIAVVAIVGAVGLGLIGIGYASVNAEEG